MLTEDTLVSTTPSKRAKHSCKRIKCILNFRKDFILEQCTQRACIPGLLKLVCLTYSDDSNHDTLPQQLKMVSAVGF